METPGLCPVSMKNDCGAFTVPACTKPPPMFRSTVKPVALTVGSSTQLTSTFVGEVGTAATWVGADFAVSGVIVTVAELGPGLSDALTGLLRLTWKFNVPLIWLL